MISAVLSLAYACAAHAQGPIVFDPGHGGDDFGAVVSGRREKDIALSVARKIQARMGSSALLTRDSDVYVPLDRRVARSRSEGASAFVSLHLNKVSHENLQGITVYYYGKGSFKLFRRLGRRVAPLPAPPREMIRASAVLASAVAERLRRAGFKAGAPERAEYYVLKNPEAPSILIELGYLSNPEEAERLRDPVYQERLADVLAQGLTAHFSRAHLAAGF